MLKENFSAVYDKFKIEFFRRLFSLVREREGSLSAMEAFSVEIIHQMHEPTISQFADFLGISQSNATYKVSSLIKKGYIVKENSDVDRREYHLKLSEKYYNYNGLMTEYVDTVMQRILEILSGIPSLVLVVLMLLIFEPGITSIILAMTISSWIPMARVVRAETLKIKQMEYVQAARALGASETKIALSHILPNISGIVIVRAMFSIPTAIFFETFLSFLGVGMRIPNASIGTLLNGGYKVFKLYPYQMFIPALILCVIMLSFNLFADGLRDVFDPKMKEG